MGPDHYDVAGPLNNLADLYTQQDRYEQAEPLYQRALSIWRRVLGADHPNVGYGLYGLADFYTRQGKYEQAEPLYLQALHIWEQA